MDLPTAIRWPTDPTEAIRLQRELAATVVREDRLGTIRTIAGADIALDATREIGIAGILVYEYPTLRVIEQVTARAPLTFPYIPGLLGFREGPILFEAMARLRTVPDLFLFDGQGIAHPRRCGIATHLGVLLDRPTIGCAKSLLCGSYTEPAPQKGAWSPLINKGETIGAVVRTRDGVRPIFVSLGHRISLPTALDIVLHCCDGYRIPKPTREADRLVARAKHETQDLFSGAPI